jgi:hypothetical protein
MTTQKKQKGLPIEVLNKIMITKEAVASCALDGETQTGNMTIEPNQKEQELEKEIVKLDNGYKYKHTIVEGSEKEGSSHHLFDYIDVKDKIEELFGSPLTEQDHLVQQKRIILVMDNMPCFVLTHKKHMEYHNKIRHSRRNIKAIREETRAQTLAEVMKIIDRCKTVGDSEEGDAYLIDKEELKAKLQEQKE